MFMLVGSQMSLDSQLVAELPESLQFKNFANLPLQVLRWVLGLGAAVYSPSVKAEGEVVRGRMLWIIGK